MAMVNTIHGPVDEAELQRVDVSDEDDAAYYTAVEYYRDGELVHRSAHVALKQGLNMELMTQRLN